MNKAPPKKKSSRSGKTGAKSESHPKLAHNEISCQARLPGRTSKTILVENRKVKSKLVWLIVQISKLLDFLKSGKWFISVFLFLSQEVVKHYIKEILS